VYINIETSLRLVQSWYLLVYINNETSIRLVHTKLVLHQVPSPHQAGTGTRLVGYVSRHTSLVGSLLPIPRLAIYHVSAYRLDQRSSCHILIHILEFSLKSPCLHPVFGPPFIPYALFE